VVSKSFHDTAKFLNSIPQFFYIETHVFFLFIEGM